MLKRLGSKSIIFHTLSVVLSLGLLSPAAYGADSIRITKVKPTIFFPKASENEPLRQIAKARLNNPGVPVTAQLKISIKDKSSYLEDLGVVKTGATVKKIHILDIAQPTEITFELYRKGNDKPDHSLTIQWQPQRKWTLYDVAFSHHDLGFADYYHTVSYTHLTLPTN